MSASSEAATVETLRWRDGRLELIDQRLLPGRLEYLSCSSAAEVAVAIRSMAVRGAPAIGCAAAFGVALEAQRERHREPAQFRVAMDTAFRTLAESRPTAATALISSSTMKPVSRIVKTKPRTTPSCHVLCSRAG